ncbi:MAG TPA: MFS transporter [Dehalococcoidia bacterium]|nr:MFS transporter [Dehalococcoidia bacterium]
MADSKRPRFRLFYGWYIVGACVLISVYCAGIVTRSFTVLIEPIVEEFHWSYALVSFAASISGLESGLLAPLVGFLFDRWGPRKLIFAGATIMGLGLLLLSRASSLAMFYASFILMSTAISVSIGVVPMTVVGNWFRKRVSLATGIVASGTAAGGILVPLVTWVVDTYDWRTAMVVFGLGAWAIIFPLAPIVRHRPEQYGYSPDGEVSQKVYIDEVQTEVQRSEVDFSAKQALKSRAFWQISLAMVCHFMVSIAVLTHVMPYLSSIGIPRGTSGWVAMAIQLLSIAGRLSFGWFGDRFDKRRVTAIGMALMATGMLLFNYVDIGGTWLMITFIIFYGIGFGGPVPMSAALIREYFGRVSLGTVLGLATGVAYVGSLIGPPLTGWIYDTYGSYQVAWFIMAGLAFAGMVGFITVPPASQAMQVAGK